MAESKESTGKSDQAADDDVVGIEALSPETQEVIKEAIEVAKVEDLLPEPGAADKPNRAADDDDEVITELKAWIRREIHLAACGVHEHERKELNP
jgi:hypothetical protein